jgi:Zn-dependent protease
MNPDFIFSIIVLILSVVVHEVSHGYAAYLLGDNTALYQGRLTLNPFKHLEWFGSFLLPLISYQFGGFIIGWAKPVPFNPYNLSNQRWGEAIVALAGPASNIILAVFFGLLMRFGVGGGIALMFPTIVFINLVLATFNLVPVPPLDGSKILFSILPLSMNNIRNWLERNGTYILLFFIFFMWRLILPVVYYMFSLITGV